jgi:hypothetical protein
VGIECLLLFCRAADIDLPKRVRSGQLLAIGELDGLARAVRQPIETLQHDWFKLNQSCCNAFV